MMIVTRPSFVTAVIAAMAVAAPARAQSAEAETLFREGKRLMKKGQIAQACDKLDASDRLEPTDGTELNLADCREKNGQLATAWAMFVKAAAAARHAGNAGREAEARKRAAALEPRLVYLTIEVPEDSKLDGLVVKRNDAAIDRELWDQRVPVDPDEYQISAEAPGRDPWSTSVVVKTRSKKVEVPVLDKLPEPRRAPAGERAQTPTDDPTRAGDAGPAGPAGSPAPGRLTGTRKLALGLAAVGVVAAGVGVGFGLHASSLENQADATCPDAACTDPNAVAVNRSARRAALYANLGFAVGGAAVITAAVLWFTGAPKARETVSVLPTLDPGQVGISFVGGF